MNSNNLEKQKDKVLNSFKEKKFQEVIVDGENLLKERQNDAQLLSMLGLASINLQNFVGAENYFEKLILFKKSAENFYTLGNIQKKLKKFNQAVTSFEEAIKLNPNFSEAFNNLGSALKSLNKYDEAIINYKKSIKLNKNNVEACYNLASLYFLLEKYIEALDYYKKILNLNARHEEICEKYTICLFKTGNKNEIKDFAPKVITKYPGNRTLNNLLGQSLLALNFHKEGLSYIKNGAGFLQLDENGVKLLL